MKIEKSVSNCKFVYTINECGYDEVIEQFPTSKEIYIMTYNISSNRNELMNALNGSGEDCKVYIISNIPQRFGSYFSPQARQSARNRINLYMRTLSPENFESRVMPYFNFNNHSKIILSDKNVYVGSANYSIESRENYESGFVSYDKEFIAFLKEEVFKLTIDNSEPYFNNLFARFNILILNIYTQLFNLNTKFEENFYHYEERGYADVEIRVYNTDYGRCGVDAADLEDLTSLLYEVKEILNKFEEDYIYEYETPDEDVLNIIENFDTNIIDNSIDLIEIDSYIYDVCRYNYEAECDSFINEYSMEAYDEYVDSFTEQAADVAMSKFTELAESAETDINQLMTNMATILENINRLTEDIVSLSEQNPNIDNTNL